ncbi:MAG: DEAD/DEAH box helicase [Planctomycetia bacterium]|nr:DEAD/DEAH box helicase [Planctomycetia bacterium]
MSHWLLNSIEVKLRAALAEADRIQLIREIDGGIVTFDADLIEQVADALELAVLDLETYRLSDDKNHRTQSRKAAADCFRLLRILPHPEDSLVAGTQLLRAAALAVLGDRGADAARWLRLLDETNSWPKLPINSTDWGQRCHGTLTDIWLRLIRKNGWSDRDIILDRVAALRTAQEQFESKYLKSQAPLQAKRSALELIAIYHLAKAADILAHFITDGVVDGNYQVQQLLDSHFDRAIAACETARLVKLEAMSRLMSRAAAQLVDNSIWSVTRAVNSRVTDFVRQITDRGRGDRALFDVLPPQRQTLAERGLLGSSRRAIVVSLPTSSGKTLIAQFRMLQALNQFEDRKGWVAYLAPSRALVNQVTRQLRRDFGPLNINVERVSPAMEIDSIESNVLKEVQVDSQFRVLVSTPEKFDLMLRQGWEQEIGRPLTLVVVDEAHTIQDTERGLKLELLLATINRECRNAQFLLLTPFIRNAREVARWLGGQNSDDISIGIDWQPNDRAIGIVSPVDMGPLNSRSRDYRLEFETVHTSRQTIAISQHLSIGKNENLAPTLSKAKHVGTLAAIATRKLMSRGPVIAMHSRPDYVWGLAEKLKSEKATVLTDNVNFVKEYVAAELGESFPLVDLLQHRIGVHHGGLPDEVKILMEWLFEKEELDVLAATTTIAQGVNFPVSGVVMAATSYPAKSGSIPMPPEDFWNIAGRAGRISQAKLGVVSLVATDAEEVSKRKEFIHRNTGDLNSALIQLAQSASNELSDLGAIVYRHPEWSGFLQYLVHTYRQMGQPSNYSEQIEQVLRGTFGFEKLRYSNSQIANSLLAGINDYVTYMAKPRQPLKLVDSTGFSLQSIQTILSNRGDLGPESWDRERLFRKGDGTLKDMMGVLLRVPELRDNLNEVLGGSATDGDKLALILKDWVNGEEVTTIANRYFRKSGIDETSALTKCGQNLFGKLTQTSSWGLNALLAITASDLPEDVRKQVSNIPSQVFYGVSSDGAIALRLLGVPRRAAAPIAIKIGATESSSLPKLRKILTGMTETDWNATLGPQGSVYYRAWRIFEGVEN